MVFQRGYDRHPKIKNRPHNGLVSVISRNSVYRKLDIQSNPRDIIFFLHEVRAKQYRHMGFLFQKNRGRFSIDFYSGPQK